MVSIQIDSTNKTLVEDLAILLFRKQLILEPVFYNDKETLLEENNRLRRKPIYRLEAKTKSVLFSEIERMIKDISKNTYTTICSLPISHMDWHKSSHLISTMKAV